MRITFETSRKINLTKAVRGTHRLGLKEAKDLVEQGCYTTDPFALTITWKGGANGESGRVAMGRQR
jgi:hypothetical protein